MSMRAKPPFRADHVGSLLRPAALKKAREQRVKGDISTAELKAGGDYSYLCTFPGHNALMRGKFKFG